MTKTLNININKKIANTNNINDFTYKITKNRIFLKKLININTNNTIFFKLRRINIWCTECGNYKERSVPTNTPHLLKQQGDIQENKKLWTKSPRWNNDAYEEKEKSHFFTYSAQHNTNFHPFFNQKEIIGT